MEIADFDRLFAHDIWANREVLNAIRLAGLARPLELMAHILSAERLWLERLRRQAQSLPVWPDLTREQCDAQAKELSSLWPSYLHDLGDRGLERTITYKNTIGEMWTNRVEDILLHVITHSVYHRGQIATAMRAGGATPAYTDFIHSIRQGLLE